MCILSHFMKSFFWLSIEMCDGRLGGGWWRQRKSRPQISPAHLSLSSHSEPGLTPIWPRISAVGLPPHYESPPTGTQTRGNRAQVRTPRERRIQSRAPRRRERNRGKELEGTTERGGLTLRQKHSEQQRGDTGLAGPAEGGGLPRS